MITETVKQRIVHLVASGKSTHAIATATGVGMKAVNQVRSHILRKLNVKNATELAHFLLHKGEIPNLFNLKAVVPTTPVSPAESWSRERAALLSYFSHLGLVELRLGYAAAVHELELQKERNRRVQIADFVSAGVKQGVDWREMAKQAVAGGLYPSRYPLCMVVAYLKKADKTLQRQRQGMTPRGVPIRGPRPHLVP